jgi:Leucine-rich repeat (LRR) protein
MFNPKGGPMLNFKSFSKVVSVCLKFLLITGLLTSLVLTTLPVSVDASTQIVHPNSARTFDCGTVTDVPTTECDALVALYDNTDGDNWNDNGNWLGSTTVSDWYGVTVTGGHVTHIDLTNNLMNGTIPQDLEDLSMIKDFSFGFNELSGGIPAWLGNLTTLEGLAIGGNQFGGEIPSELGDLINLTGLLLFGNELTGSIPSELGKLVNVTDMHLNNNQLSGSIPPELGDMTSIQHLWMTDNQLEGSIPEDLGDLSNLISLHIDENQLTGSIPSQLGDLSNLELLTLNNNNLTGSIPSELGDLSNLELLDLKFNQLDGSIPQNLENLSNIKDLGLAFNNLSGGIPAWLGSLTTLENLGLGGNPLGGEIPSELGDLANLTSLMLFGTEVTGSIPSDLGKLDNLIHMHLNCNNLTGEIPPELGNMDSIEHLWMGQNQLEGSIPEHLGDLTVIRTLFLEENQLSGDIPDSLTNLTTLCLPGECYDIGIDYGLSLGYNHLNTTGLSTELSDYLAVYDPDWQSTQAVEETIPGETGGTITSNDGNTEIIVPVDAVEGDVTFTFDPQPEPNYFIGNLVFTNNSFELTAQDSLEDPVTEFDEPLTITLHYDEEDLAGTSEEKLFLYYWNEGENWWLDAVTTCDGGFYTRNLDENWLSVPVCHLSEFALLGEPVWNFYLPLMTK